MRISITPSLSSRRLFIAEPFMFRSLTSVTLPRALGNEESVQTTMLDRNINIFISSEFVNDYQLRPDVFGGARRLDVSYISSDSETAAVNPIGYVTHITNGSATLSATAQGQTKTINLTFSTSPPTQSDTFQSYLSDSLAYHISNTIDSRLVGKNKADNLQIFATQNHTTQLYVRNPNVWCADLPNLLTCLSPWNSTGGNTRAGTLISPRHILFAAHYQINTNATVRFVKMDGTVVNRTMTAKLTHPSYVPYYPDITIGVLNEDVPSDLAFAKVLPDDWEDYLPTLNTTNDGRIPALTLDQEEKALVTNWYREGISTSFITPTEPNRLEMYESKIGGDSGNPAIIPVNGDPVLLTVWTFGGAGSGTSIREHKTAINTMMTTLGGGYQLTEVSLSGFQGYGIPDILVTGTLNPDATGTYSFFEYDSGGTIVWKKVGGTATIYWSYVDNRWELLYPTSPGFVTWVSDATTLDETPTPSEATNWVPGLALIQPQATGTPLLSAID